MKRRGFLLGLFAAPVAVVKLAQPVKAVDLNALKAKLSTLREPIYILSGDDVVIDPAGYKEIEEMLAWHRKKKVFAKVVAK